MNTISIFFVRPRTEIISSCNRITARRPDRWSLEEISFNLNRCLHPHHHHRHSSPLFHRRLHRHRYQRISRRPKRRRGQLYRCRTVAAKSDRVYTRTAVSSTSNASRLTRSSLSYASTGETATGISPTDHRSCGGHQSEVNERRCSAMVDLQTDFTRVRKRKAFDSFLHRCSISD